MLEYLILGDCVSASCLICGFRAVLVLIEVSIKALLLYLGLAELLKDLETSREARPFLTL